MINRYIQNGFETILPFNYSSDDDLIFTLFGEYANGFPLNVIDKMTFNALNPDALDDLDKYLIEGGLVECVSNYLFLNDQIAHPKPSPDSFNLLSFNICSLPNHFDAFIDQCLNVMDISFDISVFFFFKQD